MKMLIVFRGVYFKLVLINILLKIRVCRIIYSGEFGNKKEGKR